MKVTAILKGKTDSYGKRKVYIRIADFVNGNEERSFTATKIKVKPTDFEKGIIKKTNPDWKRLNQLITAEVAKVEVKALSPDYLPNKKEKTVNKDFFAQFDDFIETKRKVNAPGTIRKVTNAKKALTDFQQYRSRKITFDEIDFNFYESLKDYLLFNHVHRGKHDVITGMKVNSAFTVIKILRGFLNNRIRKKIIQPIVDIKEFKIQEEETDAIYLSESDIQKILTVDLSQYEHLNKYRYLLVLGCRSGMRWSDFSSIDPKTDLRGTYLYKKQQKSDGWVVVPLRSDAFDILVNVFKKKIPEVSQQKFNDNIKEVGRLAGIDQSITFSHRRGGEDITETKPKYNWITSHTCRRSFCTNEFLAGTPPELIMKISGHKSLRDFYRYIRITPEQAAQQIEKIWNQRENHLVAV